MEDFLRVGVITQTHGIKGEVKVFPTTDDPRRFDDLKEVIVAMKREQPVLTVKSVKYFKQYVILQFEGYEDINLVQKFLKCDLLVTRENAIPLEKGEFFICDLVGLKVVTDEGETLGTLKDVMQTGANDVYVVDGANGKEILIPSIPECILEKNPDAGFIKVHLLKGLLNL